MSSIRINLEKIYGLIDKAARKVGRDPAEIRLVAVSKRISAELINEAFLCGQQLFGENYLQEAVEKISHLDQAIRWHFIGHLQSNKASMAAGGFDMIETVDRLKVAKVLNRQRHENDGVLPVLVQVNIGRELQKSGVLSKYRRPM